MKVSLSPGTVKVTAQTAQSVGLQITVTRSAGINACMLSKDTLSSSWQWLVTDASVLLAWSLEVCTGSEQYAIEHDQCAFSGSQVW